MKNIIDFIKDKSYYFLGGTVIILILIIIIGSCSSNFSSDTYESLENKMVDAAKSYYSKKSNLLPNTDGGVVKVSISTLVEAELLSEIYDINDGSKKCSGYVEVTKVESEYSYIPFLTCSGSYEPEYLVDKLKEQPQDEYGNGIYNVNGEFIFRGEEVDNYIKFNDVLWRVIKIDNSGDIKIVLANRTEDFYSYDDSYNSEIDYNFGIVTNYLQTDVRKTLKKYYDENITKENKAKIVSKDLCVGPYSETDEYSVEIECSVKKENEKIGLLSPSDYHFASLSNECTKLDSESCINYNYLANDMYTWLLNPVKDYSYKAFFLSQEIVGGYASDERPLNPVVYLTGKVLTTEGIGTLEEPYVIK